ncbi:MAG: hypothetical protein ACKOEO_22515 [Planctomycetaceae bacterium]
MSAFLRSIRRPRRKVQLLTAVWVVLFACALCWRMWAGLHYSRLLVSFAGPRDAADQTMVVFLRTATGELWELQPDDLNAAVWSRYSRFPAARSIVAAWYDAAAARHELPEVRMGLNWEFSQRLSVRRVASGSATEKGLRSFAVVAEYLPERAGGSLLSLGTGVINWQGDGLLIAVAAVQAVLGTLLVCVGYRVLQISSASNESGWGSGQRFSLAALPMEVVRLILLLLFGQQFWVFLRRAVSLSSAESALIGGVLVLLPWLLIYFWVRGLRANPEPRRLVLRMVFLTLAVSVVKLFWLAGNEFRPIGDYEAFQRLGTLVVEGRWEEIGREKSQLAFIYLRRAVFCVSPIVYCFGAGLWKIEVANVVVQAVSALLVCELVRRMFGLKAAACTLPLILIYPDFLYSAGMVSHNVWGYFWIPVAWLIYDEFRSRLARNRPENSGVLRRMLLAMFFGTAFGLCCTVIEFLKSYGVFMLAGAVVHLILTPILLRILAVATSPSQPQISLRLVFLAATVVLYVPCVAKIDRQLMELTGLKVPPQWTFQYIAAMTASGFEEGHCVLVWVNDYAKSAEGSQRFGVLVRQLLHEKLANSRAFLKSLLRKNSLLAFGSDAMILSQDNEAGGNQTRRAVNFATGSIQHFVCEATVCLLILFCLARLLSLPRIPMSAEELLPLLTTGVVMTFIYLLTEAHPYYAQNFGYPCCWSAGLVISRLNIQPSQDRFTLPAFWGNLLNFRVVAAVVLIGLVISGYLLLGDWVDRSGLTFHRVAAISEAEVSNGPDYVTGEASVSRTTAALTLQSEEAVVPGGIRAVASFLVISDGTPLRGLRFFLSGNQHSVGRRVGDSWQNLPVRYRVEIEGKEVRSGPVSDFRRARLMEMPAETWLPPGANCKGSDHVKVSLFLETTAEFRWPRQGPDPAVAVEYIN